MMTCTAKELCAATGGTLVQDGEGFSCVSTDSRRVEQGCLFIPLVGERFDGHTYLTQALESGAAGCLCSRLPEALVPGKFYVQVEDTLRALGQLAGQCTERRCAQAVLQQQAGAHRSAGGKRKSRCMVR